MKLRDSGHLCDWAYLQLVDSLATAIYPTFVNERRMLAGFLLGQSGYRIRFGRSNGRLSYAYSTRQVIYGRPYYPEEDGYCFVLDGSEASWWLSDPCPGRPLDLAMEAIPVMGGPTREHSVNAAGVTFDYRIPQALLDFYASYPHTEMVVKANAPFSECFREAAYPALEAALAGKGEVESVNLLLRFVGGVMGYESDRMNWGYEKWNFPEESCFYPRGDCDDHAILFCRLVRELLGLDVLLVECNVDGGPHAAAAVRFNEMQEGDTIQYEGQRYYCCEPTSNRSRAGQRLWKEYEVTKLDLVR